MLVPFELGERTDCKQGAPPLRGSAGLGHHLVGILHDQQPWRFTIHKALPRVTDPQQPTGPSAGALPHRRGVPGEHALRSPGGSPVFLGRASLALR